MTSRTFAAIKLCSFLVLVVASACAPKIYGIATPEEEFTKYWMLSAAYSSGDLNMFAWDEDTGELTPTSQGIVAGVEKASFPGVTPNGKFVYIPREAVGTSEFSGYSVDAKTGVIAPLAGSPFATPDTKSQQVVVHPTGGFIYVKLTTSIQAYSIDAETGIPTSVGANIAAAGRFQVAVDPLGKYLYASSYGTNTLMTYLIDASTGALSLAQTLNIGVSAAHGVVAEGSGGFVYVLSFSGAGGSIKVLAVDRTANTLSVASTVTPVNWGVWLGMNPAGTRLAVARRSDGVDVFDVNAATGALTRVPNSPIVTGAASVEFVSFSPDGRSVITSNHTTSSYRIDLADADGALSIHAGSPSSLPSAAYAIPFFSTSYSQ